MEFGRKTPLPVTMIYFVMRSLSFVWFFLFLSVHLQLNGINKDAPQLLPFMLIEISSELRALIQPVLL